MEIGQEITSTLTSLDSDMAVLYSLAVDRLGGLYLPRNDVTMLTDRFEMTPIVLSEP